MHCDMAKILVVPITIIKNVLQSIPKLCKEEEAQSVSYFQPQTNMLGIFIFNKHYHECKLNGLQRLKIKFMGFILLLVNNTLHYTFPTRRFGYLLVLHLQKNISARKCGLVKLLTTINDSRNTSSITHLC